MTVALSEPRWGTVADAAEEFNVAVSTVRRWIAAGTLSAERVGPRRFRVDLDSLSAPAASVPSVGLPTPPQLIASLSALESLGSDDIAALARAASEIRRTTDGDAVAFSHVWGMLGAVAARGMLGAA